MSRACGREEISVCLRRALRENQLNKQRTMASRRGSCCELEDRARDTDPRFTTFHSPREETEQFGDTVVLGRATVERKATLRFRQIVHPLHASTLHENPVQLFVDRDEAESDRSLKCHSGLNEQHTIAGSGDTLASSERRSAPRLDQSCVDGEEKGERSNRATRLHSPSRRDLDSIGAHIVSNWAHFHARSRSSHRRPIWPDFRPAGGKTRPAPD